MVAVVCYTCVKFDVKTSHKLEYVMQPLPRLVGNITHSDYIMGETLGNSMSQVATGIAHGV